jgi:hypothetical protein
MGELTITQADALKAEVSMDAAEIVNRRDYYEQERRRSIMDAMAADNASY